MSVRASGTLQIHAAPSHLLRQVQWSISRALRYELPLTWAKQTALPNRHCAMTNWAGTEDLGPALASLLAGWKQLHFEITMESSEGVPQCAWFFTPSLGLRHRQLDAFGNIVVNENELSLALASARPYALAAEIENLLARPWEVELEPLRLDTASAPSGLLVRAG